MGIVTINPATGRKLRTYREHTARQCERAVARARATGLEWRRTPLARHALLLRALARELRRNQAEYAALATLEMGKPVTQASAEVEKSALGCDFYAEHGAS